MQSFDQSLMFLMQENLITYEEALKHCTNPDDFALRVKGILATSDVTWEDFERLEKQREEATQEAKVEERKVKFAKPGDPRMREGGGTGSKR
jgi:twitching motility protein PilT